MMESSYYRWEKNGILWKIIVLTSLFNTKIEKVDQEPGTY